MSKFCHNCGKQMPTADSKFCPYCGTSLQSLSSKPTPPQANSTPTFTPFQVRRDDDDEYIDRIDHLDIRINALEVDIHIPKAPEPDKLGAIAAKGGGESFARPQPFAKLSESDFLRVFEKEAGPAKGSTTIG